MSIGEAVDGRPTPTAAFDGPTLLVDGHVHCHGCFDADRFLTAAAGNLREAGDAPLRPRGVLGVLMLTEGCGSNVFEHWRSAVGRSRAPWAFRSTGEDCSLVAVEDGPELIVVAGQQVRTKEGLEVLAYGTTRRVPDGLGLRETVERTQENAMAVSIPWGFGKWWPPRGRLVARVMEEEPEMVFLSDSGGRPRGFGTPPLIRAARGASRPVLAGSDPLPLPDHEGRAGSFGFRLPAPADRVRPAESIAGLLRTVKDVETFGAPRPLVPFVRDQFRLLSRGRRRVDVPGAP